VTDPFGPIDPRAFARCRDRPWPLATKPGGAGRLFILLVGLPVYVGIVLNLHETHRDRVPFVLELWLMSRWACCGFCRFKFVFLGVGQAARDAKQHDSKSKKAGEACKWL